MSDHPCPSCGHVHSRADAAAVGRFRPSGPTGYRAVGGPVRATRAEAETDACTARGKDKP